MHGQDARVIQSSCGGFFLFEAPQAVGIGSNEGRQYLDGHISREPQVACSIDFAHASGSEQRVDCVVPESSASDQFWGRWRLQKAGSPLLVARQKRLHFLTQGLIAITS